MPDTSRGFGPLAIIIMGVAGSGKSTLGLELARVLACPFVEGDRFHTSEAISKMRASQPLTDDDRWPWLDRLGEAISGEISMHQLAVAACSALKRSYRDRLRQRIAAPVRFVLLDGDREELWHRLSSRSGHFMPAALLSSQLETLERPQVDEIAITLDAELAPPVLCQRVVDWLAAALPNRATP